MPLRRDDVDAVSIVLSIDGQLAFSVLLTRGGLTKRFGSSEARDPGAVMVTGGTDRCFEDFMNAVPETLLERGDRLEDDGRDGPRYDWKFEFASGPATLAYHVGYHWGSASLPDEFADMVVRAEALTHTWYMDGVAEATGAPRAAVKESSAREQAPNPPKATRAGRPKAARPVAATRERIALAILLDLFALSIPYSLVHGLFFASSETAGPPGGAFVLFAIVEFVLLQIARRSPGYWLLGITAAHGEKPRVDPARTAQESPAILAVGVGLCGLGVSVLTAWTTYHSPVPYFGLSFPLWLSIPVTMLGSLALVLAGVLLLRLDIRGVWLGGGLTALTLLASVVGWSDWSAFVGTAAAGTVGEAVAGLVPFLFLVGMAALALGLHESWKRLGRPPLARGGPAPAPSATPG